MPVPKGTPRGQLAPKKTCTVEGCLNRHAAHGLCSKHYGAQWAKNKYRSDPEFRRKQLEKEKDPEYKIARKRQRDNPARREQRHFARVARRYGLTRPEYVSMWQDQDGKCKICSRALNHNTYSDESPQVDHCHTTGKVRGILCRGCNRGLGGFRDSAETMLAAIEYIKTS